MAQKKQQAKKTKAPARKPAARKSTNRTEELLAIACDQRAELINKLGTAVESITDRIATRVVDSINEGFRMIAETNAQHLTAIDATMKEARDVNTEAAQLIGKLIGGAIADAEREEHAEKHAHHTPANVSGIAAAPQPLPLEPPSAVPSQPALRADIEQPEQKAVEPFNPGPINF